MLPEDLIEVWKTYGYGTFMNGYLKVINPDGFKEILGETLFKKRRNNPILVQVNG